LSFETKNSINLKKDEIMKCVFLLALAICLASSSTVVAQGNLFDQLRNRVEQQGRDALQRQFGGSQGGGQQQGGNPEQPRRFSLPSEGGKSSGGGGQSFLPGDGGFDLPGFAGQPRQPNPGGQPSRPYQPDGSFSQPGNQFTSNRPAMPSSPVTSSQYVLIRCPQSTPGSVSYTLSTNGLSYGFTMSSGQEQHFRAESVWFISYFDGTRQRRHQLQGGRAYQIKRDANNRWQLFVTN
jgi:hypothetical protein